MLIYKNTFDNIMTLGFNFPIEDQYYANDNEAIVADGITRDPIGISDFSKCTQEEFINKYPRPSGAELASKTICDTFPKTIGSLLERLTKCNEAVNALNKQYIKECDYLENDYYGSVAACITLENDILNYAYICDCGVIIYDNMGNIKFKTEDDKELYSDPYINQIGISWDIPDARVIVRSKFRNNPDNIVNGICVSYGALTGENSATYFIKSGQVKLESGDTIVVYSDGLSQFLYDTEFINHIIDFDKDSFEEYMRIKSRENYKYGKEKTLVVYRR